MSVKTRADVKAAITALITDATGSISAADLRSVLNDIADSDVNITTDTVLQGFHVFDVNKPYIIGELVYYDNTLYIAINDVVAGIGVFDPLDWEVVGSQTLRVQRTLTSAEILALNATPIEIVPGVADRACVVERVVIENQVTRGETAYATSTTIELITDGANHAQASSLGVLDTNASRAVIADKVSGVTFLTGETQIIENTSLMAQAPSADPTGGTHDVILTVYYKLLELF